MKGLWRKLRPADKKQNPETPEGSEEPCNAAMTLETARVRSFTGWPHSIPVKDMAMAGFYYTGKEDKVRCFFCDLPLNNWESTDVPMEEHLKHRPGCLYIKERIGGERTKNSQGTSEKSMIRDYTILQELSKGSYGTVYHVTRNRKEYAVKEMESLLDKKEAAEYEIQYALGRIEHQNLVKVHEFFSDLEKDRMYVVMEFCGGGSLNDHVINEKPTLETVCGYMEDMANGLNFLHDVKIMHRDLKPDNVLLAVPKRGGRKICKLADFGLTKALGPEQEAFFTFCGTEIFMAPEVGGPKPYTFSADVFSLGLVFFTAATRKVAKRFPSLLEPRLDKMGNKLINEAVGSSFDKQKFSKLYFRDMPDLGDLIADMVSFKPEDRPNARHVLSKVRDIRKLFAGDEEAEEDGDVGGETGNREARFSRSRDRDENDSGVYTLDTKSMPRRRLYLDD